MNPFFNILFLICLVTHGLRSGYELLKHRGKISPKNKMIYRLMFTDMTILWTAWFMMCEWETSDWLLPAWLRGIGFILFLAGTYLFFYTLIKLRTFDNYTGELIQTGIFSIVRHPMYLGFIFWLIGYSIFQEAPITLLTSILWIPNIFFWRTLEEKQLEKTYPEYRVYKEKTIF